MYKSIAILKIIVWSFVALFFIGVLLSISSGIFNGFHVGGSEEVIREKSYDVSNIDRLKIKWVYGNTYITSYDGDKIVITEKANSNIDNDELFEITESNGTLSLIQDNHIHIFNMFGFRTVTREIKLPIKVYEQITTDFTSGELEIDGIKMNTYNVRMTSGRLIGTDIKADKLITDITSGSLNIKGSMNDIQTTETSGRTDIESDVAPSKLSVSVTSGTTSITIPDNDGFVLGKHKTSGSFSSEFRLDDFGKYKNGSREYLVKMTSGSVHLLKK